MEGYRRRRPTPRHAPAKPAEPFEKKLIKQLIFCAVLILALLLFKGIPVSGGVAGDYAKTVLNYTTDIKKTASDITVYVQQSGLLPQWGLKKAEPQPSSWPEVSPDTTRPEATPEPKL